MSILSNIKSNYARKSAQAAQQYNQTAQGLRNEENTLKAQMQQLQGQQQADQGQISNDQKNLTNVANQEQTLSNQMSGSGSVGSQYQASLTKDEQQTGYDETAMQTATANQQQATGAISAYKDTLKTAWASNGQNNNVYQAQQQKVEKGLNSNVQSAGRAVQVLQGAYEAATKEASQQAEAYYKGETAQMEDYKNLSSTYQGLLTQDTQKYENDVKAYNDASTSYNIAASEYSFATEMYGYTLKELYASEQEDVFAQITMPALAAQTNALASKEEALTVSQNQWNAMNSTNLAAAKSEYNPNAGRLSDLHETVYRRVGDSNKWETKTFTGANAHKEADYYGQTGSTDFNSIGYMRWSQNY